MMPRAAVKSENLANKLRILHKLFHVKRSLLLYRCRFPYGIADPQRSVLGGLSFSVTDLLRKSGIRFVVCVWICLFMIFGVRSTVGCDILVGTKKMFSSNYAVL